MFNKILLLLLTPLLLIDAQVQIKSGTTLNLKSGTFFVLSRNISNSGTLNAASGSIVSFRGSETQTITNTNGETFADLLVNKPSNNVKLLNNITLNGTLTLTSGKLNLNNNSLSLGDNASVVESQGNRITGGSSAATRSLNAPSSVDVGGMGAIISSGVNLGNTTVTRGHTAFTAGGNNSISRSYNISPTTNTGLDATLVFCYDETELNGLTEANLVLFRSTDGGTTWTNEGGTLDAANNKVTLNNIDGFSVWTLAESGSPLPVELVSFSALIDKQVVKLEWQTATEINNYGFEVERTSTPLSASSGVTLSEDEEWETIAFVNGHGNSNSPKMYSYEDENPFGGKIKYRLKQIDFDGQFEYSDEIEAELLLPSNYELYQNYPNTFNPVTNIRFDLPEQSDIKLIVYNILGEQVKVLVNQILPAGFHKIQFDGSRVASGLYIYRMIGKNFVKTKKMMLVK